MFGIAKARKLAVRVVFHSRLNPHGERTSLRPAAVPIIPSRDWSSPHAHLPDPQEPEAERKPSLLGLSMRMCEPEFAMDNVWHVLDVLEGSPAESAGLVPYGDWIIGWSGGVLAAEGDFYDVVEAVRASVPLISAVRGFSAAWRS